MKEAILIIVVFFWTSCKAQSPIVGLDAPSSTPEGAYYKDLNGELDKFTGTWKLVLPDKEFTIVIQKRIRFQVANDYRDYLIGEYSYKENGEVIINTLPNLQNSMGEENIGGSYISKPNRMPKCDTCDPGERRINMYFQDPERKYLNSDIVLRYISGISGNPPKVLATIYETDSVILPYEGAPEEPRVPYGEYLLVKQ